MFSNYAYHSSISDTFKKHCTNMAKEIKSIIKPPLKNYKLNILDIASNDGCLLEQFKLSGYHVTGIEPCEKLCRESEEKGISTINGYWDKNTASRVTSFSVVTATNVLAHVDDLRLFVKLVSTKLSTYEKGIFVFEVPYLYDLITDNQFDTIYHEHLSYFLFKPIKLLLESCGMRVFKVKRMPIHGGSLRIYASLIEYKGFDYDSGDIIINGSRCYAEDKSVSKLIQFEKENKLYDFDAYRSLSCNLKNLNKSIKLMLWDLFDSGKKVAAYCASAKGINLINYCGIDKRLIQYIVDDTPEKQYKEIPGSRIQIVPKGYLEKYKPDYLIILSWNFSKEIVEKTKQYHIPYIIPIPYPRIIK